MRTINNGTGWHRLAQVEKISLCQPNPLVVFTIFLGTGGTGKMQKFCIGLLLFCASEDFSSHNTFF